MLGCIHSRALGIFKDGLGSSHIYDPLSDTQAYRNKVGPWLVPGLGRSPGGGHGNSLQCSRLENPVDGGGWQATVHGAQRVGWAANTLFSLYDWIMKSSRDSKFTKHVNTSKAFNNLCYSYTSLETSGRFFYQYFSCHPSGPYSVSLTSFWNWLSVLSLNPLPSTPGVPVEDWVEYLPVVLFGQGDTMLWRTSILLLFENVVFILK